MALLLQVTAAVEDLGYLTDKQKSSGDLRYYVYVSVIDSSGKPVTGLAKQNFKLVMFDGIETIKLDSEWEMKHMVSGNVQVEQGFYGLTIERPLKNETVLPEARLFGLSVTHGADAGQTIFKVSYQRQ